MCRGGGGERMGGVKGTLCVGGVGVRGWEV